MLEFYIGFLVLLSVELVLEFVGAFLFVFRVASFLHIKPLLKPGALKLAEKPQIY